MSSLLSTIQSAGDIWAFLELSQLDNVNVASPGDLSAEECPAVAFVLYEYPFMIGLKWPFPALARDFLSLFGIPLREMMPQFWRVVMMIDRLSCGWDPPFSVPELLLAYAVKADAHSRYSPYVRGGQDRVLILGTGVNDRGWKEWFVFCYPKAPFEDDRWVVRDWLKQAVKCELLPSLDSLAIVERFRRILDRAFSVQASEDEEDDDTGDGEGENVVFIRASASSPRQEEGTGAGGFSSSRRILPARRGLNRRGSMEPDLGEPSLGAEGSKRT